MFVLLYCFSTHLFKLLIYGRCSAKAQHVASEKYFMSAFVEKLRQGHFVDVDCTPDESIHWCILHSHGALVVPT